MRTTGLFALPDTADPQRAVAKSPGTRRQREARPSASRLGFAATTLAACVAFLAGCAGASTSAQDQSAATDTNGAANAQSDLPTVTVGSYPLAFIAETVGGAEINLVDLSSTGGHAHDMELSPAQVGELSKSDLALYLSQGFQPAVETAIAQTGVDSLDAFAVLPEGVAITGDPHVWLDPQNVAAIGEALATALDAVNPENDGYYQQNAAELAAKMDEVDSAYEDSLRSCAGQTLLASHEAFGYLAARFDLDQVGVLGVDPDAEPSPARLRQVQQLIKDRGITTLFAEPAAAHAHDEDGATVVQEEGHDEDEHAEVGALGTKLAATLGIDVEVLDPAEVQVDPSKDLVAIFRDNLASLQHGLPCATAS